MDIQLHRLPLDDEWLGKLVNNFNYTVYKKAESRIVIPLFPTNESLFSTLQTTN
jgi:hypothetical protein